MERTINGKSVEEAFKLLKKPFTGSKKKREDIGTSYIPGKGFQERMAEVFGFGNIWVEFTEPQLITVTSTGQELFTVTCHLTIYDDSGNIFRKSDGIGAVEILATQQTGKQSGLAYKPSSAATQAYKDACKRLGIFGESPADEWEWKSAPVQKEKVSMKTIEFSTKGAFEERKKGSNSSWRCPIQINGDSIQRSELVIFQNIYKSSEKVRRLVAVANGTSSYIAKAKMTYNKEYNNYVLNEIL